MDGVISIDGWLFTSISLDTKIESDKKLLFSILDRQFLTSPDSTTLKFLGTFRFYLTIFNR